MSYSYTKELELLITDTLLPVYEKYHKSKGDLTPLRHLNPDLLRQLKAVHQVPALFKPKEIPTCDYG